VQSNFLVIEWIFLVVLSFGRTKLNTHDEILKNDHKTIAVKENKLWRFELRDADRISKPKRILRGYSIYEVVASLYNNGCFVTFLALAFKVDYFGITIWAHVVGGQVL